MTFSPGPASFIRGPKSASPSNTRGGSRVPEWGPLGSVRGALSNERPYRDLRNVVANYPFESSRGFPGSAPNSGHGDHSRLSCSAGDKQLGASPRPATAAHRRQPHSQPQSWTDRQAAKGAPPARRSAKVLNRARGKALSAPFAHHQLRHTRY